MSLNWDGKWDPYYSRLRRSLMRPSAAMALNWETTTVQSLLDILQRSDNCGHYFYQNNYGFVNIDCDEVYPNIYIGNGTTAKEKYFLKKIGITHVLNTAEGRSFSMVDTNRYFYEDVRIDYMGFPLLDHPSTNISRYFYQAADFIHDAICGGGKVYVHCLMGMSRSSTCVIAYLMIKKGMSAASAIRTIKEKRNIHPNVGFLQQLADLDNDLKKKQQWGRWNH